MYESYFHLILLKRRKITKLVYISKDIGYNKSGYFFTPTFLIYNFIIINLAFFRESLIDYLEDFL